MIYLLAFVVGAAIGVYPVAQAVALYRVHRAAGALWIGVGFSLLSGIVVLALVILVGVAS